MRLNWHVFGHNGHFEDPEGLVTASLTRRMAAPSPRTKAISRIDAVSSIDSAHFCRLKPGWRTVDANGRTYSEVLYPGRTDRAHVNHYQCRSFLTWMDRVRRGDVSFDRSNVPADHRWRLDEHLCLRQFVETVARNKNELVDDYMLRFERPILSRLGNRTRRDAGVPGLPGRNRPASRPPSMARRPSPRAACTWFRTITDRLSNWRNRLNGWRLRRRLERSRAGK